MRYEDVNRKSLTDTPERIETEDGCETGTLNVPVAHEVYTDYTITLNDPAERTENAIPNTTEDDSKVIAATDIVPPPRVPYEPGYPPTGYR